MTRQEGDRDLPLLGRRSLPKPSLFPAWFLGTQSPIRLDITAQVADAPVPHERLPNISLPRMDIQQGRQFLAELEQVVEEAGLAALVEHERDWTLQNGSGPQDEPEEAPFGAGPADDVRQTGEASAVLDRIVVLLDLVEAAMEIEYDVAQEVLAMAERLSAEDLIAMPHVTFASPENPANMGVEAAPDYAVQVGDAEFGSSAAQGDERPHPEQFNPIWRMRDQLGVEGDRMHPVVVDTWPRDWSTSWRMRRG